MKGKKDDDKPGDKQEEAVGTDETGQDGEAVPMSTNQILEILSSQVESPLPEVVEEDDKGKEKEGEGKKKKKSSSALSFSNGEDKDKDKKGKKKGKLQTTQS